MKRGRDGGVDDGVFLQKEFYVVLTCLLLLQSSLHLRTIGTGTKNNLDYSCSAIYEPLWP